MSVSNTPTHINLKFIQVSYLFCSLLNYSLLRFRCFTCIGVDSVTTGSLCFKCCFRLKERNMSVQVLTSWQTALDSPCQSGLLNSSCFGKGEYLLKDILGWTPWSLFDLKFLLCNVSWIIPVSEYHLTKSTVGTMQLPFAISNTPLGVSCHDHRGYIFQKIQFYQVKVYH